MVSDRTPHKYLQILVDGWIADGGGLPPEVEASGSTRRELALLTSQCSHWALHVGTVANVATACSQCSQLVDKLQSSPSYAPSGVPMLASPVLPLFEKRYI